MTHSSCVHPHQQLSVCSLWQKMNIAQEASFRYVSPTPRACLPWRVTTLMCFIYISALHSICLSWDFIWFIIEFVLTFFFFWSSVSVKIVPEFEESLASEVEAPRHKNVGLLEGPREYYTKWSKSNRERQIVHGITYMWNLKKKTIQLKLLTKQTHRYRKQTYGFHRGKRGEEG